MRSLSTAILTGLVAAALSQSPAPAQDKDWVTIKGQVVYDGEPPQPAVLKVDKDQEHCLGKGPLVNQEWVVNSKDKGVKNVFVWLTAAGGGKLKVNPELATIKDKVVTLDQPRCAFEPHVVALREGQTLRVHNSAPVAHNISWQGSRLKNPGNNVILPPGGQQNITNFKADTQVVSLSCNIHPWMKGWLRVFDGPYYAVTDDDGNFEIKLAPAGKAHIVMWHEGAGWVNGDKNGKAIELKPGQTLDLGTIKTKK